MLTKWFKLEENNTTIRTELMAGLSTFLTMAYVVFVNPAILSTDFAGNPTGLSADAALLATCLAAFENFFFVSVVMALTAMGITNAWQVTLGITFIAGLLFLLLAIFKFRKALFDAISPSMKNAIAVGIGFFIAFIGLQNAGLIIDNPGSLVTFNTNLLNADTLIFFAGFFLTAILTIRKIRGAILWGILFNLILALIAGRVTWGGFVGLPQSHAFFKLDILGALKLSFVPFILIFLFMDMFDTMGTLIGVGQQTGLLDEKSPKINKALISDAVGTAVGSLAGTSTITSYIESIVGVQYGGRTGLTSVTTGLLFLLALFFTPLIAMVGGYLPITAPALVFVGSMMVQNIRKIEWEDLSETVPSFLIMLGIPLSYSIHDGLAMGLIAYPILKSATGKWKEIHLLSWIVAAIFVLRYLTLPHDY